MKKPILALFATAAALLSLADATENVTNLINTLDPLTANVLSNFVMLTDIPRPTCHEKQVSDALAAWARARGFTPTQDAQNNVWFDVPATAGMEATPRAILQGHLDMVAVGFADPTTEHVTLDCDTDGRIFSRGHATSIGADDGIGIAMAMMVADGLVPHGPLRVLATTDEERSQTGAIAVPASVLQEAPYCINIDLETDGELTISSAANDTLAVTGSVSTTSAALPKVYCMSIRGFRGGHSGLDIDKGRLNVIIEMGHLLTNVAARGVSFELGSMTGGDAENAIPPHAEAIVTLDESSRTSMEELLSAAQAAFRARGETVSLVELIATNDVVKVFDSESRANLLNYLTQVHNGVWSWSRKVPGLVETSVNLGRIRATADGVSLFGSARGSEESALLEAERTIEATAAACGYGFKATRTCAPWPADPDNPLIGSFTNTWRTVTGEDMKVTATHAGLECGWFAQKSPALGIVSFGPAVSNTHTVGETTYVTSVSNGVQLLAGVLATLPKPAPTVQLGVVAQRYPWDGTIDIRYKACNVPDEGCPIEVTVTLPDGTQKSAFHVARNGEQSMAFDAKAAFGEVSVKGAVVRIRTCQ